jgi:hypothetical protein
MVNTLSKGHKTKNFPAVNMQVFCSNCNTAHDVTHAQAGSSDTSVITCRQCNKKIKFQFCPHCGAFYSITFSNIKHGRYKYSCRKCMKDFAIEFKPQEQARPAVMNQPPPADHSHKITEPDEDIVVSKTEEPVSFMSNSINTFSAGELFRSAAEAFTAKKLLISAAGVISMLLVIQLFSSIESLFIRPGSASIKPFAGSLLNLFPMAIIFSFYTLAASVISKITLDKIFHSKETGTEEIIRFTMTTGPGVFGGNIILLITIVSILILFGKIPFLGPLLFSLAFLPVYLMSIGIFLLCFIGLWFYPPIAAHREQGVISNLKNLLLFIKKHNLNIIFMIPVILLAAAVTFSLIFFIHLSAFSLSITMSKWLLSSDAPVIFSSIPALFINASEATLAGLSSGIFKELNTSLMMTHHMGGFILGLILLTITVFLLSLAVSITATISSHIYIVMERGISIDDRKKAMVLFILMMLMTLLMMFRKLL